MELNILKPPVIPVTYGTPSAPASDTTAASAGTKTTADPNMPAEIKQVTSKDSTGTMKESRNALTQEEMGQVTDNLNKFMAAIDTDLRFQMHEKLERLMVQVVSRKDQRVIKEIPSHELLDTLAAIRDYIGVLLDKKA